MKKSIFHVAVLGLLTSIAAISCDDNTDVCQERKTNVWLIHGLWESRRKQ